MAYRLPTFNLLCNLKAPPTAGVPAVPSPPYRLADQPCQLTYGRRVSVATTGGTAQVGVLSTSMNLLLPSRTDVRGPQDVTSFDMVEVPSGSGRWYYVTFVDDIGKGFANEHRTAGIYALASVWVPPYP